MFSSTRQHYASIGISDARRIQGFDLKNPVVRGDDLKANEVVAKAFEDVFLPRAASVFASDPEKKWVMFSEDGTRKVRDVTEAVSALGAITDRFLIIMLFIDLRHIRSTSIH